jgi:hypothetical protein
MDSNLKDQPTVTASNAIPQIVQTPIFKKGIVALAVLVQVNYNVT